jgi:hypothetical protein
MSKNIPAHLAKYAGSVNADAFAVHAGSNFPRINCGNNRFTAVNEEGAQTFLSVTDIEFVVIDGNPNYSKTYYEGGYDANSPVAPSCASENGFSPLSSVANPQAQFCHECPKNQWGSAVSPMSGKAIKACADFKKLAIYLLNDNAEGLFQFRIPSASLQNWGRYMRDLASFPTGGDWRVLPHMVVTQAKWSDKLNVLTFERVDFLDEEWMELVIGHQNAKEYEAWIGTDYQSQQRPQLESQRLKPATQIERKPTQAARQQAQIPDQKVIDVEPEKAPPAPRRRPGAKPEAGADDKAVMAKPAPAEAPKESPMDRAKRLAKGRIPATA